jgi:ribosomal protein S18 acetylase RimI-like enzyme
VITYRTFRNNDPPRILQLWNRQSALSRGFGRLPGCDLLEYLVFSKPYFDREGLFLACDADRVVGICHPGFQCDESESRLDTSAGAICMLLVDPEYRCRGIGSELLRLGQDYLRRRSALVQYLGPIRPLNAFYLGLYGGSELPGVLNTDPAVAEFVRKRSYQPVDTCFVYQRRLHDLPPLTDPRAALLRRQIELTVEPWPIPTTWWRACTIGPMPAMRYEMLDHETRDVIGWSWVWVMESFTQAWNVNTVGIAEFEIKEALRRQGFGKLMLFSMLRHLLEQNIGLVEVQTMERNSAARGLYESLGFTLCDSGQVYRLSTG